MTLGSVIERLADLVDIEVIIDDYGTVGEVYRGIENIDIGYFNSVVETIDTSEDVALILTINGNTGVYEND